MIRVQPRPEPGVFDAKVRMPGRTFLAATPKPTGEQWKRHAYWQRVSREMYQAYEKVCAYTCHYIAPDTGIFSVDHFRPKDRFPLEAYEWSNFRLACTRLNGRKHTKDILDPFLIEDGWFTLIFPLLHVVPDPSLPPALRAQVQETIDELQLCDEGTCVLARQSYVDAYCGERITFEHLEIEAPFLAKELVRQALVEEIKVMWLY